MIKTVYTALSGMTAYRKGLDAISNNVANLNTPGYKAQMPLFLDIVHRNGAGVSLESGSTEMRGGGVAVREDLVSFTQGELRSTGNSLDAALDGAGFFVLQKGDQYYYSRAGQFEFDKDGYLVERTSGARVVVRTDELAMTHFNVEDLRTFQPRTTTTVNLAGNLSRSGTPTYQLPGVLVYDQGGGSHTLTVNFVHSSTNPLQWTVEIREGQTNVIGSGAITFNADGSIAALAAPLVATITPTGLDAFDVTIDLGAAGTYTGLTSLANDTQSRLQVAKQDGVSFGTLTTAEFDDRGQLTLKYTNGEKRTPATLLLARFATSEGLVSVGNGQYVVSEAAEPELGTAQSRGLGRLVGGQIELSNVELTGQFTDLIIIQRGYQASSQMASVANEMTQQLLSMGQGRS
jgi:flagellar hook protein FlgE